MSARTTWMGVLAAAVFGLAACAGEEAPAGVWPAPQVALATVESRTAPRARPAIGALEARQQVTLAAEAAGRITQVAFASGQAVRAGDVLVQLNDATEQAERQRLRAQLRQAEQSLARTRELLAARVATQAQWEQAQATHDMARAALAQIEAAIAQKTIRAPFSGVVGIRRVHAGQYLNAGDAVVTLVDAEAMLLNFALDEQYAGQLQAGQAVQLHVSAWPAHTFTATIQAVDPLISQARMVQVQASVPNAEGLLQAGMFANVRVLPASEASVPALPEMALMHTAYGQTVFVAQRDDQGQWRVRRAAVRTGEHWDGWVEVLEGVAPGEQIVVSGQIKLSDGMTVAPQAHPGESGQLAGAQS